MGESNPKNNDLISGKYHGEYETIPSLKSRACGPTFPKVTVATRDRPLSLSPPTFCVQINSQALEDVHVTAVGDGLPAGLQSLALNGRYGLGADIQHQRVDELDVVVAARLGARLQR